MNYILKFHRRLTPPIVIFFLGCLCAVPGVAGQDTGPGTLTGHVHGPAGVAVPGATVQITNLDTGGRKETWSNEEGDYTFTNLKPGNYKLETSLVGFQADVRQPVLMTPGRNLRVNVSLVMQMAESNPAGEASSRAAGGNRQGNGRADGASSEAVAGALGQAGNTAGLGGQNGNGNGVRFSNGMGGGMTDDAAGSSGVEENASASASNSFLLGGGMGVSASAPPQAGEANVRQRIMQFRAMMQARQGAPGFGGGEGGPGEMMAFFGGGPGGGFGGPGGGFGGGFGGFGRFGGGNWAGRRAQVNRLRGNILERFTDSELDARPYPLNIPESPRIPSHSEILSGSIGGPVVIPKIYNGKDKTSFFVNYGLTRATNALDTLSTVPTLAERSGDFSNALITNGALAGTVPVIYNPNSNPLTPFTNNQIPQGDLNGAALGLLRFIPTPNLPGQTQNYHLQASTPSANDRVMARIGQQISSKDSLNVMYFFNSARTSSLGNFPTLTQTMSVRGQNVNISEVHTLGPRFINTMLVNFNRQRSTLLNGFSNKQNIAGNLGITGISTDPLNWGVPQIGFTNFTGLNDAIPSLNRNQTVRLVDTVLYNHGKHNVRFGGEVRRVQQNPVTDPNARGTFTFSGYTTSDFTANGLPVSGTGYDFADFLLGLPQTTSVRYGDSANYFRAWVFNGFLQDDWRVLSHLTLNYGLRYEYFTPFTEKYGHLADLAFNPGFADPAVVTGQQPGSLPDSLLRGDAHNLAPRVGLAYRPWLGHSMVVRAGYGIFYDGSIYSRIFSNMASQPPFAFASTLTTAPTQVLTLQNGFPRVGTNTLTNTYAIDPNFRTPYAQSWNLSVEQEIARNVILSVGYTGTKGSKLDLLLAPYQIVSNQISPLAGTQPFTYETSGADSIYHSLNVELRRQFHGGFSISGVYTYSKAIDDAASVGGAGRTVAQNYLDLQAERSLSSFDMRHRLIINHMYELPFGEQRHWLNKGGVLAEVVGNWQVSGVTTIHSGSPFTATALGNLSNFAGSAAVFNLRANATGQPASLSSQDRTTQEYFNTAAFVAPPAGAFGNAGRGTITGPGAVNFNMSLDRFFIFSREKGIRGDFRVDANNIFNTPAYGQIGSVVNSLTFGRVTSVGSMRVVDFVFRLNF